jgi:hypothetical protein
MGNQGNRPNQRVRLGITGLAAVFLLVLAAAALIRPDAGQSQPASPRQDEPLAMLGVAPAAHHETSASR